MVVYKITNLITNKIYIGQTKHSLNKRFNQHCLKSSKSTLISNSIQKYSASNFKIEAIVRANNQEELNHRERMCIRLYKSLCPSGYNLTNGGYNGSHCEEVIQKMRALKLGKKASLETRIKLSQIRKGVKNSMYGKKHSPETRQKISSKLKEMRLTSPRKGIFGVYKHTKESKEKLSKKLKGVPNLKNRGKKRSESFKKLRSEICTKQNQKKVINRKTGEVLNSAKELAGILQIPYSTLVGMLNGGNPNRTDWNYLIF